jgi:hypothetical protein
MDKRDERSIPDAAWRWGGLALALVLGGWLRWPGVFAAYPYLTYVDEGHLLHPVRETLATGTWDPSHNNYPQLPVRAIASAARLLSTFAGVWPIAPAVADAKAEMPFYDQIEPPELILVGRLLSWLLSLGIIALVSTLAFRQAGETAGVVAGFAAALLPALVLRGSAIIVDLYATLFVLAAMTLVPVAKERQLFLRSALAGCCCGCAAISKYPAGLALVAVAIVIALLPETGVRRKLTALAAAGVGAALAAAILMPSTWQQPAKVWRRMVWQGSNYSTKSSQDLWQQAFKKAEWDLPPIDTPELGWVFVALALLGLVVLSRRRASRAWAIASTVFIVLLVALHSRYAFQAFRNLLPAAGLGCVAFGAGAAWGLGEWIRRPRVVAMLSVAALLALFLPAGLAFRADRGDLVDSRRQAIDWLLENRGKRKPVMVLAEIALPRRELERLPGRVLVAPWDQARPRLRAGGPRFLVVAALARDGRPLISDEDRGKLLEHYRIRTDFGDQWSEVGKFAWRGNRLQVWVLERRGEARPPAR